MAQIVKKVTMPSLGIQGKAGQMKPIKKGVAKAYSKKMGYKKC